MWPQQTGSHSQSIPLCNSLEAASTSSSCCSLVSSSSLEVSWASRPPRSSWPPCPFRTHGPPLGLLNVEGFHMMTLHHDETDDKQDDIDNTIYHGYMQDDNTGQKVRRNKLVVIVIDGWVDSIHQLFLRRKINKEIDFKSPSQHGRQFKPVCFTLKKTGPNCARKVTEMILFNVLCVHCTQCTVGEVEWA